MAQEGRTIGRLQAVARHTDELFAGVSVGYEYQSVAKQWWQVNWRWGAPRPWRLQDSIRHLLYYRVGSVDLYGAGITDECLAELASLKRLKAVRVRFAPNVTDAGIPHLAQLKHLRSLWLAETGMTNEGAAELRRALPRCKVDWSPPRPKPAVYEWAEDNLVSPAHGQPCIEMCGGTIDDTTLAMLPNLTLLGRLSISQAPRVTNEGIRCLAGAKHLKRLTLHGTSVTQAGVDELQNALPNCKILYLPAGPPPCETKPAVLEELLRYVCSEWLGFSSKAK